MNINFKAKNANILFQYLLHSVLSVYQLHRIWVLTQRTLLRKARRDYEKPQHNHRPLA